MWQIKAVSTIKPPIMVRNVGISLWINHTQIGPSNGSVIPKSAVRVDGINLAPVEKKASPSPRFNAPNTTNTPMSGNVTQSELAKLPETQAAITVPRQVAGIILT